MLEDMRRRAVMAVQEGQSPEAVGKAFGLSGPRGSRPGPPGAVPFPGKPLKGNDLPDLKPPERPQPKQIDMPVNLILYGPPGTGKTYTTIEEGVRSCDGQVPGTGRAAI
jgi:Cdc6-like AAA superfamily ATPase